MALNEINSPRALRSIREGRDAGAPRGGGGKNVVACRPSLAFSSYLLHAGAKYSHGRGRHGRFDGNFGGLLRETRSLYRTWGDWVLWSLVPDFECFETLSYCDNISQLYSAEDYPVLLIGALVCYDEGGGYENCEDCITSLSKSYEYRWGIVSSTGWTD